ncbi:uncharacterized protein LOC114360661 [Ostrinia furnacalis]|uniref:uncharacterized protein LOC114360661 n=1 Tax=Ostrinia furnacalis TaxID=93504 RepID=UPI0010394A70|nr:uncharacterized protein LOC114360661 [Ostrinia furnacalis]
MISRIAFLLAVVGLSCAATWQGYLPPKPAEHAHKTGCYVKEIDDVIPFGKTIYPIGHCYRIECTAGMMYYASCGKVMTSDDTCYVTEEDLSKPYPDCCPHVKCIEDNSVSKN